MRGKETKKEIGYRCSPNRVRLVPTVVRGGLRIGTVTPKENQQEQYWEGGVVVRGDEFCSLECVRFRPVCTC